jgi:hypothetical protein
MRPTPPLRAQWLALCNAYTEQIADSLGRRLGATKDPMVAGEIVNTCGWDRGALPSILFSDHLPRVVF